MRFSYCVRRTDSIIMVGKIPFSQLWREEEDFLVRQTARLGKHSVIVEIGTAQGGSAYIFAQSTLEKHARIYSYDILPSQEAFENLHGLHVHIIAKSSADGAREWQQTCGSPIDLLFIDGSHTLEDVYRDFTSWFPYVKVGGKILFHDYDPIHRGGFPHLGVRVFIDALKTFDLFSDTEHVGRIFAGVKNHESGSHQFVEECARVWGTVGKKIEQALEFDFEYSAHFIGISDEYLTVLQALRNFQGTRIEHVRELNDSTSVIVLPQPLSQNMIETSETHRNVLLLDELTFFYLLYDSMLHARDAVLSVTKNRKNYFKWEELLEMFNYSYGGSETLQDFFYLTDNTIQTISKMCAREVVRLNIVKNIFLAINGKIE